MWTKAKMLSVAAVAIVMVGSGYFITSRLNTDDAALDAGPVPDSEPQQARMESVPTPQVSAELMQLPESPSVVIAPPPRQNSQATRSSSSAN